MPPAKDVKVYKKILEQNKDIQDLLDKIVFDAQHGQIWFDENRMLLMHTSILGFLRKDLYQMLGLERTKRFFIRCGYQAGMRDAEVTSKLRPNLNEAEAFMAGPQMHGIRGMVQVEVNELHLSHDLKQFYADFNWLNSFEAEVHLSEFGASDQPACWMLLGYACGYSSFVMGQTIIYQETHCVAQGDEHCRIIGKPLSEWENADELIRFMSPDAVSDEIIALQAELNQLKKNIYTDAESDYTMFNAVGESVAYRKVCDLLKKAAGSKVAVLLQGETGVGKEAFARGIHNGSQRQAQPFVAVNCACIPPDLIESELFGVEKGAFTGAVQSRMGKFERAHGGTIFLDEIGELPLDSQVKLLRVLQEKEIQRLGGNKTIKINVRIVAATNKILEKEVAEGRFRLDLYYRLNVFPIQLPSLRERKEDIEMLATYFLKKYAAISKRNVNSISAKALEQLKNYNWPGNIRELEHWIERNVLLAKTNEIEKFDLSSIAPIVSLEIGTDKIKSMEEMEKEHIMNALQMCNGKVSGIGGAAELLKLQPQTLYSKMKKLGIKQGYN